MITITIETFVAIAIAMTIGGLLVFMGWLMRGKQ